MLRNLNIVAYDPSAAELRLLRAALSAGERMSVVGSASSVGSAERLTHELGPDVVVLGRTAGSEALAIVTSIMQSDAVPIVVACDPVAQHVDSNELLHAGAVSVVLMPSGSGPDRARAEADLLRTVRAMSEVRVVTRRPPRPTRKLRAQSPAYASDHAVDVVAIGASTGGPQALFTVLSGLPPDFPVPILIVQHMAVGFQSTLLDWLNRSHGPQVVVPRGGETVAPGIAYLAPDERHMGVTADGRIELSASAPESSLRPAISYLYRSVRKTYGARSIGVLLSGMGRDGADELKLMRDAGAVTIAQDEATSVVYGMPKEAVLIGGATHVLGIDKIAPALVSLVSRDDMSAG